MTSSESSSVAPASPWRKTDRLRARLFALLAAAIISGPLAAPSDAATLRVPADFATIQAALDAAGAGDTVEVAAGVYNEKLVFTAGGDATGGFLTLRADPAAPTRPILDGTGVAGSDMIRIESKSYVRIEGFEIRNNLGVNDGSGIRVLGSGSHIEILDNVIHDMRGVHAMGITIYGTEPAAISDLLISDNEIYDCEPADSEALTLNGNVQGFVVADNLVRDVNNIAIDCIGGEKDIQPNPALVCREGVIRGNTVVRARHAGGFAGGIYVDGGRDVVVENNTVTQSNLGIEIGAENSGIVTTGVVVRNNVVYGNDRAGLVFGGFKAAAGRANDNEFRGNTLYRNNTLGRQAGGEGEVWVQWAENNLLAGNLVVAGPPDRVFISSFRGSTGNVFDYNLYASDIGGGAGTFELNGTAFADLAAWQSGSGLDEHAVGADPLLRDAANADFHIDASSPAFDAGDPAYLPEVDEKDLDGQARRSGARVDIGADEAACGDGILDPGEQCDDGNQTDGDGCDRNCTLTACGNGIATPATGEECDDGNQADGDCCASGCTFENAGAPCDDGAACSNADVCDGAGRCAGSFAPLPACTEPLVPRGARVRLRDHGEKDALAWKWGKAPAVAKVDFGEPASDGVTVCVYAADGGPYGLLVGAAGPPGIAWEDRAGKGYRYRSRDGTPDGLTRLILRPGEERRARIKIQGKGPRLGIPPLSLGPAAVVSVQLRAGGRCFGATYRAPFAKNTAGLLKATSD